MTNPPLAFVRVRPRVYSTKFCEVPWALQTRLSCGEGFRKCIEEYKPDLVVSLHPLCQNLPMTVLKTLHREGELPRVPFATVCTDLGGAHLSWFRKETDAVFVPSDAVRKVAERRGVPKSKIRQYGLPVRSDFWRASDPNARASDTPATIPARAHIEGVGARVEVGGGTAAERATGAPPPRVVFGRADDPISRRALARGVQRT